MKKLLTLILTISILASLTACGDKSENKNTGKKENEGTVEQVTDNVATEKNEENDDKAEKEEVKEETKEESKEEIKKPSEEKKPAQKNEADKKTEENKKPEENKTPVVEEKPQDTTLGQTLLSAFKSQANAGKSVQEIADALITNPAITFAGGAMSVEEGLLSGFDNAEITGFKKGAMFAPMIGSIAFVGYVFELEDGADTASFIANLRKNANLRWNICVTADEMVTGSAGNKVFFVMCPTSLEG